MSMEYIRRTHKVHSFAAGLVFAVLWVCGLAIADAVTAAGHNFGGSWYAFFGGMWMLVCMAAKQLLLALWRA
jgi:hypothetical protein